MRLHWRAWGRWTACIPASCEPAPFALSLRVLEAVKPPNPHPTPTPTPFALPLRPSPLALPWLWWGVGRASWIAGASAFGAPALLRRGLWAVGRGH